MVCASLYMCMSAGVYADTHGCQKGYEIPQELELQMVVNHLM